MARKMQSSGGQQPTVTPHNGRKREKLKSKAICTKRQEAQTTAHKNGDRKGAAVKLQAKRRNRTRKVANESDTRQQRKQQENDEMN